VNHVRSGSVHTRAAVPSITDHRTTRESTRRSPQLIKDAPNRSPIAGTNVHATIAHVVAASVGPRKRCTLIPHGHIEGMNDVTARAAAVAASAARGAMGCSLPIGCRRCTSMSKWSPLD
jgi:hypothetical protein